MEECFKRPGRRKRDAPPINVVGKLANLILAKVISQKYLDHGIPVVEVHIKNIVVSNTLIDIGD